MGLSQWKGLNKALSYSRGETFSLYPSLFALCLINRLWQIYWFLPLHFHSTQNWLQLWTTCFQFAFRLWFHFYKVPQVLFQCFIVIKYDCFNITTFLENNSHLFQLYVFESFFYIKSRVSANQKCSSNSVRVSSEHCSVSVWWRRLF